MEWKFERIYYEYQGQKYLARFTAVFAFGSNDIWVGSNQPMHWNGSNWQQFDVPETIFSGYVSRFWGTSSSNIYMVGASGNIAHYNGSIWQKIESGTTLNLHDIYGATDSKTGEQQIITVGSSNIPFNRVIFRIQGTSVTILSSSPIEYELIGVWFVPNQHYYVVGDGVFEKTSLNESTWKNNPLDITSFGMSAVRGNGINDIFSVGSFMEIVHYNGSTWYNYSKEIPHSDGALGALSMKGNTVIAGGQTGQDAIILMGKR